MHCNSIIQNIIHNNSYMGKQFIPYFLRRKSMLYKFDSSPFSQNPLIRKYNTNIVHAMYVCTTRGNDNWRHSDDWYPWPTFTRRLGDAERVHTKTGSTGVPDDNRCYEEALRAVEITVEQAEMALMEGLDFVNWSARKSFLLLLPPLLRKYVIQLVRLNCLLY